MIATRRRLFQLGATMAVGGALPAPARAWSLGFGGPRRVALHNLHTGETLDAVYYDAGRYVPDALAAVNKVLRDFRTGDVHPMRPELLDLLHTLTAKVDSARPIEIISGYRSPESNAMLHETTSGVASKSLHTQGMATDIRIQGVQLSHLHKAALGLQRGGVGYYPSSDFVHVDVGPVRRWG